MAILFGLAMATFLVIGWACGSIFVCVFCTLPVAALAVFSVNVPGAPTGYCLLAIAVIWAPYVLRRHKEAIVGGPPQ